MSGIGMMEEASFQSQWRQTVQSSPEAEEARRKLEMHRRKIRQIQEELRSAEILEEDLELRLKTAEIRQKTPIMSFAEKLEDCQGMEEDFVEETFSQIEETEEIISVLREKEKHLRQMNRSQLLGFIKTVLVVRDCLLERDKEEGVNAIQVKPTNANLILRITFCLGNGKRSSLSSRFSEDQMVRFGQLGGGDLEIPVGGGGGGPGISQENDAEFLQ